jgi:precorrin-6Y C5,15-methyltransferase (decarboxylating)
VAEILTKRGFSGSKITVLEHMGGSQERIIAGTAASWTTTELADLNTIAVECIADAGVVPLPRLAGLPDDAYHHDGQLNKREVRAITLSLWLPHRDSCCGMWVLDVVPLRLSGCESSSMSGDRH